MKFKVVLRICIATVLTMAVLATMVVTSVAATYSKTDSVEFKTAQTRIDAGTYTTTDTYYSGLRYLCIHNYVEYEYGVFATPYNYTINGYCTFTYVDDTNEGAGDYTKIANRSGYVYDKTVRVPSAKTVKKVEVQHYFNYVNSVSNCSTEAMHTTFIIE